MKGRHWCKKVFYYRGREKERNVLGHISTDLKVYYTNNLPFISAEVNKAMHEVSIKSS